MNDYNPNYETARILDAAMGYIGSVEYKVGLRWIFYRLLQDGYLTGKDDYAKLKAMCSTARKRFYNGWHPSTLVDEGRTIAMSDAPYDRADVISGLHKYAWIDPDLYLDQQAVPFLIFEAATMSGQFEYFAPWADRAAFRGDASIPHKWNIAERCDDLTRLHALPVHVLYFGDLDPKGLQIPRSAMNDIFDWADSGTQIDFTRVGINLGQEDRFNLPVKPEKPDTFEWESLESNDAGTLIREGLATIVDLTVINERIDQARADTGDLRDDIQRHMLDLD